MSLDDKAIDWRESLDDQQLEYFSCNLCGSNDNELILQGKDFLHGSPGLFSVVRCCRCGLIFLNPRPSVKEMDRYYPSNYQPHNMPPSRQADTPASTVLEGLAYHNWKELIKSYQLHVYYGYPLRGPIFGPRLWVLQAISKVYRYRPLGITPFMPGGWLLDVGCGSGSGLADRQALGWQVQGVEPNVEAAARAQAAGFDVFIGDLLDAKFPPESFDVVRLWWVFEHLHDPLAALVECQRILKPGGYIVLLVPNFGSPIAKFFGPYWFALDVPRHLNFFTPRHLKELLDKAGFVQPQLTLFMNAPAIGGSLVYWAIGKGLLSQSQSGLVWNSLATRIFRPIGWIIAKLGGGDSMVAIAAKG